MGCTEDTSGFLHGACLYALIRYLHRHSETVVGIVEQLKWIDENPCGDGWYSTWFSERWQNACLS